MSGSVPEIDAIEQAQMRERPTFRVGDTVNVHFRIREGDKERIQVFKGVVIRKTKGGAGATFTVRKVSSGVGVERIFPLHSPRIEKIEVTARGHVRRSRLYYLRNLRGKKARLRERQRQTSDES
ncbi:MAG: 50S ribosomal protein L19 [Myxococcales bacterium]|nr:50S ribosomal protein L19 [Myxococcales bacterium]MDH3845967.1 50S ribosomal protein L19 [Myxococcales bacterium]